MADAGFEVVVDEDSAGCLIFSKHGFECDLDCGEESGVKDTDDALWGCYGGVVSSGNREQEERLIEEGKFFRMGGARLEEGGARGGI